MLAAVPGLGASHGVERLRDRPPVLVRRRLDILTRVGPRKSSCRPSGGRQNTSVWSTSIGSVVTPPSSASKR
jgi:hypothetical protein